MQVGGRARCMNTPRASSQRAAPRLEKSGSISAERLVDRTLHRTASAGGREAPVRRLCRRPRDQGREAAADPRIRLGHYSIFIGRVKARDSGAVRGDVACQAARTGAAELKPVGAQGHPNGAVDKSRGGLVETRLESVPSGTEGFQRRLRPVAAQSPRNAGAFRRDAEIAPYQGMKGPVNRT